MWSGEVDFLCVAKIESDPFADHNCNYPVNQPVKGIEQEGMLRNGCKKETRVFSFIKFCANF